MKITLKIKLSKNELRGYNEMQITQIQLRDDNGEYIKALKFTKELHEFLQSSEIELPFEDAIILDQAEKKNK
ncbi:MAG: hypothetical protein ACTSYA_09900 [Candidatus Kariarchaeaceae archaeon]